jgi:N-acetylmuramoyl-L-alanine amidase
MSYRIHTVVIDPGHGGRDPGTLRRRHKLNEKGIVLDISKKVVRKLKQKSRLKVILTRDKDSFVLLAKRGQIANENGAGLFVSIHVNSAERSSFNGSSTYFLDAAKTDEERATAMLENAALQYEIEGTDKKRLDEVNLILQDMAQNEYLRESKDLSTFIQLELATIKGLKGRGLRQANFAVLRGTYMPAALIETAYISNASDEKQLNSARFRTRLAEAITAGILKYIDHYHRKLASGS